MSIRLLFSWYDYIIFLATLAISTLIGIYYGCFGTKQSTISEYLMGNKKMKWFPVGLSLAVSHFSAITIIGVPADVYKYGASYWLTCLALFLHIIIIAYVFLPVFFKLNLTSIYEYLEKRFDKKAKLFASFLYILEEMVYCSLLVHATALALSVAIGTTFQITSITLCVISVFYTTIGGFKTVIWTDLFQFLVIIVTLIIILIIGVRSEDGFLTVWNKAIQGKRLDIFDFDINPSKRDSFWILAIGFSFKLVNSIGLSQTGVQKFLTLPSFQDCILSLLCFATGLSFIITLNVFNGLLLYSKYSSCDPVLNKQIEKHDQLIYYYMANAFKNVPGISGLFSAALVCSSLRLWIYENVILPKILLFSSFSCTLNAMSGVIYKDFMGIFYKKDVSEKKATNVVKLIVILIGLLCTCIVLVTEHLEEVIPQALSFTGLISGPSMGMFTLGILFPKADAKGALYGTICGFLVMLSITLPKKYYHYSEMFSYPSKLLLTDGCANISLLQNNFPNASTHTTLKQPFLPSIFRISFYYYCLIGAVVTVILGLIISSFTNKNKPAPNKMLISPLTRFLLPKVNKNAEDQQALQNLMQ